MGELSPGRVDDLYGFSRRRKFSSRRRNFFYVQRFFFSVQRIFFSRAEDTPKPTTEKAEMNADRFCPRKNICLTFILLFIYIIGGKTPRCCTLCCTALHTFWVKRLKTKRKDVVLHIVRHVVLMCCDFCKKFVTR